MPFRFALTTFAHKHSIVPLTNLPVALLMAQAVLLVMVLEPLVLLEPEVQELEIVVKESLAFL